jgi:hypothetical protein
MVLLGVLHYLLYARHERMARSVNFDQDAERRLMEASGECGDPDRHV